MDRLKGAAPYVETQSLVGSKSKLKGTLIYGVDPSYESMFLMFQTICLLDHLMI